LAERLWRVRKHADTLEALVRSDATDERGVELVFVYNGHVLYSRSCRTRTEAESDATDRLRQLQRAGWATHW
jgi:hypothetical protein